MSLEKCWDQVQGSDLCQGDYLADCHVPSFSPTFAEGAVEASEVVAVALRDLVILSQTCDLANGKLTFVALCGATSIDKWQNDQPKAQGKSFWIEVLKNRREGLYLLGSCSDPNDTKSGVIVDLREIYSLPLRYVEKHAFNLGPRCRLRSPFREGLSQAFGRFYMRVALPEFIQLPQ